MEGSQLLLIILYNLIPIIKLNSMCWKRRKKTTIKSISQATEQTNHFTTTTNSSSAHNTFFFLFLSSLPASDQQPEPLVSSELLTFSEFFHSLYSVGNSSSKPNNWISLFKFMFVYYFKVNYMFFHRYVISWKMMFICTQLMSYFTDMVQYSQK